MLCTECMLCYFTEIYTIVIESFRDLQLINLNLFIVKWFTDEQWVIWRLYVLPLHSKIIGVYSEKHEQKGELLMLIF